VPGSNFNSRVRPTVRFEFELEDPVKRRKIAHAYTARTLPILG